MTRQLIRLTADVLITTKGTKERPLGFNCLCDFESFVVHEIGRPSGGAKNQETAPALQ
jgi:hypothetical protein